MNKYYQPLEPGNFYHFYNRAVGSERLFIQPMNYAYFLRRMQHHISPVVDIYAYSLMPNHFHLLIKIKSRKELIAQFCVKKKREFDPHHDSIERFAMKQFSNWLNGYVKAFNKMYSRKGGLFMDYCKRTRPETAEDLKMVAVYIHRNAVHHGISSNLGIWENDSYYEISKQLKGLVKVEETVMWFGGREQFIRQHEFAIEEYKSGFEYLFSQTGEQLKSAKLEA